MKGSFGSTDFPLFGHRIRGVLHDDGFDIDVRDFVEALGYRSQERRALMRTLKENPDAEQSIQGRLVMPLGSLMLALKARSTTLFSFPDFKEWHDNITEWVANSIGTDRKRSRKQREEEEESIELFIPSPSPARVPVDNPNAWTGSPLSDESIVDDLMHLADPEDDSPRLDDLQMLAEARMLFDTFKTTMPDIACQSLALIKKTLDKLNPPNKELVNVRQRLKKKKYNVDAMDREVIKRIGAVAAAIYRNKYGADPQQRPVHMGNGKYVFVNVYEKEALESTVDRAIKKEMKRRTM